MCRLFGLSASPHRIHAKFWLLEAPDSFVSQSHRNPDGTGLGFFERDGTPKLDKQALAAFEDPAFAREAKHIESSQFVSHIRYATTGDKSVENCHPFALDGRIFAHNGMLGDLDKLEARLGDAKSLVLGETDSERYFALITKEIREHQGDVNAGINAAVRWVIDNLPVCSINFVLATPDRMWAFRYPETDKLYVLERAPGGHHGGRALHYVSSHLRVHSLHLAEKSSVVVASEPLDDSTQWRLLRSGELIEVAPDLTISSRILADGPPPHVLVPQSAAQTGEPPPKHDERPRPQAAAKPQNNARPH